MISGMDASGARPIATIEPVAPATPLADPRQESLGRLMRIAVGQTLQAQVIGSFSDGTFLVKVADADIKMALPGNLQTGDQLTLKLTATEPRPAFEYQRPLAPNASLSDTAQLIGRALQETASATSPPAIVGAAPLIEQTFLAPLGQTVATASALSSAEPTGPSHIASALHDAVSTSGVFYESHLVEWAENKRPLDMLLREPQASLLGNLADNRVATADIHHAQLTHLVGVQLDALENQRVSWQGEAWAGQKMEWSIEKDRHGTQTGDSAQERTWSSQVRFQFPKLGDVSATLRLEGDRLQLHVGAGTADSVALLRAHAVSLADALRDAGLGLDMMTVKQDNGART